jgi:hypothetical protein
MPNVARRDEKDFYGSSITVSLHDWFPKKAHRCQPLDERWQMPQSDTPLCDLLDYDADEVADTSTAQERFLKLADEWSQATMHVSSASDLINDARYQEIISLGWDAVPYLLTDLQRNKRFWFPALAAITGVRPFDPGDSSNPRRMTEAWVKWGRRKGLI